MATKDITDQQVCEAYALYASSKTAAWPYQILEAMTKQPFKVCYRSMERAFERGYIEYGTSLRTGWLTDEGKALLADSPASQLSR